MRISLRGLFSKVCIALLLTSFIQVTAQESASAAAGNFGSASCLSYFSETANLEEISISNYCVIKIKSGTATWTIPSEIYSFAVLVVGAGGGGGNNVGDGGGGGAVVFGQVIKGSATSFTASIGAGGVGGIYNASNNGTSAMDGQSGGATTFTSNDSAVSVTANGGSGGQTHWDDNFCTGSGTTLSANTAGGTVSSSTGITTTGKIAVSGSTGGKANGSGVTGGSGSAGTSSVIAGSTYRYGAGGGAGGWGANGGTGGSNGGGSGGNGGGSYAGGNGVANSGGGGGAGGDGCGNGGSGGSGVVILRWAAMPNCSSVSYTGSLVYNQTLSATSSCSNYSGISYTWWRSSISNFSSSTYVGGGATYKLVTADIGKYVRSQASVTNSPDPNFAVEVSTSKAFTAGSQSTLVAKANQSITFDTPTAKTYGDNSFTLSASDTTTSGLSITYTSATSAICTISTRTVTIVSAGTCTVNADQAGNSNYNPATQVQQSFTINKARQSSLSIGNYLAFANRSVYPLNVYGGSGNGAVTRTLLSAGSAGCNFTDNFFLDASSPGSCTVQAVKASDTNYLSETATATIYWVQWSDSYATQVPSVPTQIALEHKTQITKYEYQVFSITSYANLSGTAITSASAGSPLRIIGVGFDSNDLTTQVTFTGNEIAIPYLITSTYIEIEIPLSASSGTLMVDSAKGSAIGPSITITPMVIL